MATNFLVWNPNANNQKTDSQYAADTSRLNGATAGVFESTLGNKLFFQTTSMVGAIAKMLSDQGLTVNDGSANVDGNDFDQLVATVKNLVTGQLLGIRVITSTGTYTPTTGTNSVIVEVLGGGGAGGSCAATDSSHVSVGTGGASGSYGMGRYTSAFSGVTVTVGAGGAPVAGAGGSSGGTSSFGALLTSPGGGGGTTSGPLASSTTVNRAIPGGLPSGANLVSFKGECSEAAVNINGMLFKSRGASSPYGSGGGSVSQGAGANGSGYGSGGEGACLGTSASAALGGSGMPGVVIIREFA